ncbi:ankyrin repeat-containing domain protein [Trichoderma velutinum]
MNPINFTLGAIRLPGLFSTCLDLIERIDDYRHFKADERALAIQFSSHRLRLKKWGNCLGLDQEAAELCQERHEALADSETLQTVHHIIDIAQDILSVRQGLPAQNFGSPSDVQTGPLFAGDLAEQSRTGRVSRKAKFMWALKGKGRREDQVELLGKLVQHLYTLVPLEALSRSTTDFAIKNDLQRIVDNASWACEMRPTLQRLEAEAEAEARRELHAWLVRYPPNEIFEEAIERRLCDTCNWILERPTFKEWLSLQEDRGTPKLLWINGPAGFGKTILCASIVHHLSTTVDSPVAHFFLSSDFESGNDPYEAVRYWISSLMSHNHTIFEYVRAERDKQLESVATRALVMQLFQKIVHLLPGCTFIIDGLDECTWLNRGIARKLNNAVAESTTKILIVSRDEPAIRTGVEGMESTQVSEYKILPDDVNHDTQKYSRSIVEKKLSQKTEALKQEISQKMAEQCAGQFLWLKLQGLQALINKTPSGLDSLYQRDWNRLSRLPEDDKHRAFTLLRLITFAARPLTVTELAEASVINMDSEEYPLDDLPEAIDAEYINSEILGLCGSLLSVHQNSTDLRSCTVRLTHFSIKQYYLSHDPNSGNVLIQNETLRCSNERMENTSVARTCLRYIQYEETWRTEDSHDSTQVQGSFRDYAVYFWHRHFLEGDQEHKLVNGLIDDLFDNYDSTNWEQWRDAFDSIEKGRLNFFAKTCNNDGEKRKEEYLTCFVPPSPLTLRLIEKHPDHLDDIELINFDANPSLAVWSGNSPLHVAVVRGHLNLVQLLLENSADVNAIDCYKSTPLHYTLLTSTNEIAKLFLRHGANTAALDVHEYLPLHHAIWKKNIDMTRLLIPKNLDQLEGYTSWAPTFTAIYVNSVELMQILLEHGADINLIREDGETMVSFLICKGADLDTRNNNGRTAVALAVSNQNIESVRLLAENGADLTIVDNRGFSALHMAAYRDSVDSVRILLKNGIGSDFTGETGYTPLLVASQSGHDEVIRLLLENGANPAFETPLGGTPLMAAIHSALHYATSIGDVDIVHALIEGSADVLVTNSKGWKTLHFAAFLGNVDIVPTNPDGWTALHYAASLGDEGVVHALIERGADVSATNVDGWTALHYASSTGNVDTVPADRLRCTPLYYAKNAHLAPLDPFGNSILHLASFYGLSEVIKDQLQKSGPTTIDETELEGRTPLFTASMRGESEVVKLLLSHSADVNHLEVIQQLLAVDHIALDYEDCFGETDLQYALSVPQLGSGVERILMNGYPSVINQTLMLVRKNE